MDKKFIFLKFAFVMIVVSLAALFIFKLPTARAQTLQNGDLVRTKDSPALYLIQNGQKKIFPHLAVYLSWGLPQDFSTVKVVDDLSAYAEAEPVSFRDGSLFRGTTTSLYGKTAAAVFYVENGKLRPIKSSEIYHALFKDTQWKKVVWVPDYLLDKFAYPMGETIETADQHPDGCLVRYKGTAGIYLIEAGKLRPVASAALEANRLNQQDVIEIEPTEIYETASEVKAEEEKLTLNIPTVHILPFPNTTFLKSYRLLVFTKINGAWPTKDGGYIVSGTTDPNITFIPPDGFVAKLDKQGNIQWLKFLKTKNSAGAGNALGDEDVQSIIELENGGYLMASKVWGFITTSESSAGIELNKILFTKLDKNGNMLWNKSLTGFVEDARNSLFETSDHGFLFYAPIVDLAPSERGEDPDVYKDLPYASLKVFKFDQNGNLQWSKNIKNFISRKNDSYLIPTLDGGYALAGDLAQTNLDSPPYNFDKYPGLAKFDKNFNFEWAKSLEGIPMEMSTAISQPDGSYKLGYKQARQGASLIHGLVQTQDNGYLVLGILPGALSLITDINNIENPKNAKNSLIGFKFDSSGNLAWVKKMTLADVEMTNFSVSLTTDNKVMIAGPTGWKDDDYQEKVQNADKQKKWYCEKYQISEEKCQLNQIENIEESEQTKQDWKKVQEAYKAVEEAAGNGVFIMKVDQELNPVWAKKIKPRRDAFNYVLKPTPDKGAIIAGEYETKVVQSVEFGNTTYYKDGFLIKLDASGNVKNNAGWIVDYNGKIITEMMTPYAISNNLTAEVKPYSVKLTNRKPEFSLYKKAKTTTYAPFSSSESALPPVTPAVSAYETPLQNSTLASTATRTWPEMHYERAVPAEPINDKSLTIHNELLPILHQLYDNQINNNQVKMTDNMGGAMLDYVFDRIITKDDVTAVKNYLEGLGYKTQDERFNQLTMYKPGYFLTLTFSTNNPDKAFLEVTY